LKNKKVSTNIEKQKIKLFYDLQENKKYLIIITPSVLESNADLSGISWIDTRYEI